MTRSLVSTAATKTFSVTNSFASIQAMQKYNEKREVENELAAQAMEKLRQERLIEEKGRQGKKF